MAQGDATPASPTPGVPDRTKIQSWVFLLFILFLLQQAKVRGHGHGHG